MGSATPGEAGDIELKLARVLFEQLDVFASTPQAYLASRAFASDADHDGAVISMGEKIARDSSLQRMLIRKLETIAHDGCLISNERMDKSGLFNAANFEEIPAVYTKR